MKVTDGMVNRFLNWPLPKSVRPDPCVMNQDYPHRVGTNLLTADEARQMLEHVLAQVPPAEAPASEAGNLCHCGLPMSRNPHPDAGKPDKLLEVGAEYVCIPCLVNNRHDWSMRAMGAESKVEALESERARLRELAGEASKAYSKLGPPGTRKLELMLEVIRPLDQIFDILSPEESPISPAPSGEAIRVNTRDENGVKQPLDAKTAEAVAALATVAKEHLQGATSEERMCYPYAPSASPLSVASDLRTEFPSTQVAPSGEAKGEAKPSTPDAGSLGRHRAGREGSGE